MDQVEAVCLGYAVPHRDFMAEVHSVFNSAVNLHLLKNGQIITLVPFHEADLPQGIRLKTPEGFIFTGLNQGEKAIYRKQILSFNTGLLTVNMQFARRWKCELQKLWIDLKNSLIYDAWKNAVHLFEQHWDEEQNGLFYDQRFTSKVIDEITQDLLISTRLYDEISAEKSVEKLIGLGPGLTPAGDDYLVGFLAGLWSSMGKNAKNTQFLNHIGKTIDQLSSRTNDISKAYLQHAVNGQVSSKLTALAKAISFGKCDHLLFEAAKASMRVGHISGLMATKGLLQGISAWNT
jgi:hypothetical protein